PPAEDAPTILALPSLLNPAHILDLSRARSLLRGLARRGARPFLLDWGDPGIEERRFTLGDYVSRRVEPALAALGARTGGGPIALMGHCLAGGLAAAAASRRPDLVSALVLLAAPWDFRALAAAGGPAADPHARATLERLIEACGAVFGGVPPDVLNTLFFLRDPLQAMRKFPGFARARRDSPRGRLFVAVEDWLNDGMRLAAPAARELLIGWLLENALMKGAWRVEGRPATAAQAPQPTLIIASGADTVTPERAALAAKGFAPRADALRPSGGHVGMLIGRRAEAETWDPLAAWLKAHAGRAAAAA
ncbi:MAG: alpha/beta fold hydrolase, partial [Pseudomonadota bacterium]